MTIGMAAISLMNVMWLQVAPTAFATIKWKFYLCFIIPAYLFAILCFFVYPNTKGLALEEIAALFGDETVTAHEAAVLEVQESSEIKGAKLESLEQHEKI